MVDGGWWMVDGGKHIFAVELHQTTIHYLLFTIHINY
jgi:hypothetical protein